MKNITPARYRCHVGMCPSVYLMDNGQWAVIGKKLSENQANKFDGLVADDEYVIIVDPEMLTGVKVEPGTD